MRRHDKKEHMRKANMLFEQRCNENAFSWDGTYANEGDIHEDNNDDYNFPYNQDNDVNTKDLFNGNDDIEEGTMSLGDDFEVVEEEITNITTDISDETQWFSQVDGERAIDKIFN